MRELFLKGVEDCLNAVEQLRLPHSLQFMESCSSVIAQAFKEGKKVIIAGNGGSLCDAQHFAEELTGFFRQKRRALPAIALCEAGHLTCVGNDLGFDEVFSRGVEAYGQPGDVFVGLTTSGNSPNIVKAFEVAKQRGLFTIAFLGKKGGVLKGVADHELIIEGFSTSDRIQEAHMAAIHLIIEGMESLLFPTLNAQSNLQNSYV